jgi:CubicO group peptidase (beta-lactamase class C family)
MELSRRTFMLGVGATAAGAALGCAGGRKGINPMICDGTRAVFDPASPADAGMDAGRLDAACAFIAAEVAEGQFPGAALAVTRGGRMVMHRYWGTCWNTQGPGAPFGPATANILYSFSKAVSMTVVAMARDEGLLDFDVPVQTYIPGFEGGGKDSITLRHLLTHSAGLTTLAPAPVYTTEQWDAAVALCLAAETEWEPGSRSAYHGLSGLFIASEAARRVMGGGPWHEICQKRLFGPLDAAGFSGRIPANPDTVAIVPPPKEAPVALDEVLVPLIGHPAGGFLGTPVEMLQLLNLYLDGGAWKGRRLLSEALVGEILSIQYCDAIAAAKARGESPKHENWGLGWLIRGDDGPGWFGLGTITSPRTFGHAGIGTVIGVADPDTGLALAFLTTAPPEKDEDTIRVRNRVTDLVAAALDAQAGANTDFPSRLGRRALSRESSPLERKEGSMGAQREISAGTSSPEKPPNV